MPPKGSKRGPDGQWIAASQVSTPQKEARIAVATPQKKARILAGATGAKGSVPLPSEAAALVNVPEIRKSLNEYVKNLARTVNDDWHDSYEETDEMLCEWLQECAKQVGSVMRVGVELGAGFDCCHEVLKVVMDTWSNIQAIPFRGCPAESLGNAEVELEFGDPESLENVHSAEELVTYAWPLLLARAAADAAVTDAALMRMIKDAHEHGVKQPDRPDGRESIPEGVEGLTEVVQHGRTRVEQLVARKEEWSALTSTRKVHRMRGAIDRRFDGPRHRRTRDPRMFEDGADGADGCSLM